MAWPDPPAAAADGLLLTADEVREELRRAQVDEVREEMLRFRAESSNRSRQIQNRRLFDGFPRMAMVPEGDAAPATVVGDGSSSDSPEHDRVTKLEVEFDGRGVAPPLPADRPTVTCRVWDEESEAHADPRVWETWDGAKRHFCYRYKRITGHSLRPGDIQLFNREVHLEQNNRAVPEIGRWLNGDTEAQRATGEGSFRITARVTDVYIARDARTPRRAGQAPY